MIIDKLFALMAEKKASDIFITVGTPIHIKIDGNTVPINQQAMDPTMIHRMAYEMMTPEQVERFETTREMNLSFGRRDLGNFRINIFWQRNSIAIVVRYIAGDIPKLDNLGLPPVLSDVIMEKRGLVLVDPPFEIGGEFDRLVGGLAKAWRRFPGGIYCLWYPLKNGAPQFLRRNADRIRAHLPNNRVAGRLKTLA